jgi:3-dehydroquinate dehydratase-1
MSIPVFPTRHPLVVGTVSTRPGLKLLGRSGAADVIEARIDAFLAAGTPLEEIESALKKRQRPVLLTLRIPSEGGRMPWKVKTRRETFLRLLPLVEAIDVELATAKAMKPVIDEARRTGKTVILSAHAIARPASMAQVARWVGLFEHRPSTILKIAARIKSWRDLQQLAALLVNHPEWPLAVMGLGPYAGQSRAVLTALGSRLVYGYLDEPAAPGQPPAAEVRRMVKEARAFDS